MAGMTDGIKNSAKKITDSPAMQKTKDTITKTGKDLAAGEAGERLNKLAEDKFKDNANMADALKKVSALGVDMFNPEAVANTVRGNIEKEMKARIDLHKRLDKVRSKLEKNKATADLAILVDVASDLADRAQDTMTTAVVDGMVDTLTPESIENPAAGEYDDLDDNFDDVFDDGESPKEEEKKGFFDAALDMFDKAKDTAVDMAQSTFKEVTGGIFGTGNDNVGTAGGTAEGGTEAGAGKADETKSSEGLAAIVGNLLKTTGGLDAVDSGTGTMDAVGSFLKNATNLVTGQNPLGALPDDASAGDKAKHSALGGLLNLASAVETGLTAYDSVMDTKQTAQAFAKTMEVMGQDLTGTLRDKTIENTIASTDKSVKDASVSAIAAASKQIMGLFDGDSSANPASQSANAEANKQANTTTSEKSVFASLCSVALDTAAKFGDTAAVRQLVEEAPLSFCGAKSGCTNAGKNAKQTTANIVNTIVTATLLDIDLDTVTKNEVKPPNRTNNIAEDDTKKINKDESPFATIVTDLVEFGSMIKQGANYAKVVLGVDKQKEYSGLLEIQQQYSNIA